MLMIQNCTCLCLQTASLTGSWWNTDVSLLLSLFFSPQMDVISVVLRGSAVSCWTALRSAIDINVTRKKGVLNLCRVIISFMIISMMENCSWCILTQTYLNDVPFSVRLFLTHHDINNSSNLSFIQHYVHESEGNLTSFQQRALKKEKLWMWRLNQEWTSRCFLTSVDSKAACLGHHEGIAVFKDIKREFSTKHSNYVTHFIMLWKRRKSTVFQLNDQAECFSQSCWPSNHQSQLAVINGLMITTLLT